MEEEEYTSEYTKEELQKCISRMTKQGKTNGQANEMCELSLSNRQKPVKKEKPYRIVANLDTHYVFNSDTKINTAKDGKLIKGIEIFKAGTFKGIEFKVSALDKMVANFHFLKDGDIFPNVPMRADHAGWLGEVGVIDRVGGYVSDLRRVGTKLVADVRTTSEDMLNNITSGKYISRSAEIGGYKDNNGNIYEPILYGFAWVDIPAVEGLSPKFSFSKDKNVNLINLNSNMGKKIIDANFPSEDKLEEVTPEVKEEKVIEEKKEDVEVEEPKEAETVFEEIKVELSKDAIEFSKAFPNEYAELVKAREDRFSQLIDSFVKGGKITPAIKDDALEFVKSLSSVQLSKYEEIMKKLPAIVKFDDEVIEGVEQIKEVEKEQTADEKADEFVNETK